MSKENQKILYEHYKSTNQINRMNEILKSFPEFELVKEEVVEVKSKGRKK